MRHDRGCWKCGRLQWEYERCVKADCAKTGLIRNEPKSKKYSRKVFISENRMAKPSTVRKDHSMKILDVANGKVGIDDLICWPDSRPANSPWSGSGKNRGIRFGRIEQIKFTKHKVVISTRVVKNTIFDGTVWNLAFDYNRTPIYTPEKINLVEFDKILGKFITAWEEDKNGSQNRSTSRSIKEEM